MILKDIFFSRPAENILFDEVLLSLAEQGKSGEVLRFWESDRIFIVLGRIGNLAEDVDLDVARRDGIPILRRCSGGGAVLQGPGCLNYALVLSKEIYPQLNDLRKSYELILNKVVAVIRELGLKSSFKPVCDIALDAGEKKFSGNAQHRAKKYILHHGTILYDFDLSLLEKYLRIPRDIPPYRKNRSHKDFVTNIGIPARQIKEAFQKYFSIDEKNIGLNEMEQASLNMFLANKKISME